MNRLSINDLWLCQNEETWLSALKVYWHYIKPSLLQIEREMESLDIRMVRNMNQNQWYEFLLEKYFRWKYTAPNRYATTSKQLKTYAEEDRLDNLFQIKESLFAFNKTDIYQGLKIACQIRGLGTAGASGLLSILFPEHFGTVDQFAVKALREVENLDQEKQISHMSAESLKTGDGVILIDIMRNKAKELNKTFQTHTWTARKIDMILWTYGREKDTDMEGDDSRLNLVVGTPSIRCIQKGESMRAKGIVRALGKIYANGLKHLEIHVSKGEEQDLPHEMGNKIPVQIIIGSRQYSGGIRSTEKCPYLWVSPTLTDSDNQRTTLAEALKREGIEKNQRVELEVSGDQIRVIPA